MSTALASAAVSSGYGNIVCGPFTWHPPNVLLFLELNLH